MDIRVKSTGRELRRIDNGTALLLMEMFPEALERINSEPATAPVRALSNPLKPLATAHFNVGQHPQSGEFFIRGTDGRSELFFMGEPSQAATFKFALCGGCYAPPEIIEQYNRCKGGQKNPEWLADKALNDRADLEARMKAQARGEKIQ